jgi:hypothetical protein
LLGSFYSTSTSSQLPVKVKGKGLYKFDDEVLEKLTYYFTPAMKKE